MDQQSLSSSEWTLLAIFLFLIGSLIFIAKVNVQRASDLIAQVVEPPLEFLVVIDGAVRKPGEYMVPVGTCVSAVLRKAHPLPYADLRSIDPEEIITATKRMTIQELQEIRVHVDGAIVEPLELILPVGSRISDLKSKIGFTKDTDRAFFRRRKLLRDGDKVVVPKKTVERN